MSYPGPGSDFIAARVRARMVANNDRPIPGPEGSPDAHRYPEPPVPPDPRGQWDEIRGVWEVWHEPQQQWVEISVPLAGDDVGMAGARRAAAVVVEPDEVGLRSPVARADEVDRSTTCADPVASVPTSPSSLPSLVAVDDAPASNSRSESPESGAAPFRLGFTQPDSDLVFPEPPYRPDPYAQWDPAEGIWRVWDPESTAWVAWEP